MVITQAFLVVVNEAHEKGYGLEYYSPSPRMYQADAAVNRWYRVE